MSFIPVSEIFSSPEVKQLDAGNSGITLELTIPGVIVLDKNISGQDYQIFTLPKQELIEKSGYPMLPKISTMVSIPNLCTETNLKVKVTSSSLLTYNHLDIYSSPDTKEQLAKIEKVGVIRDQKVLWLTISPLQYKADKKELTAYYLLTIHISWPDKQHTALKKPVLLEKFEDNLLSFKKREFLPSSKSKNFPQVTYPNVLKNLKNKADYLIITTEQLKDNPALDSLAHVRRQQNGLGIAIVTTSDIFDQFPNSSQACSIKDFISYAYNNWQAPSFKDNHLGYVLFVGEGEKNSFNYIPFHSRNDGFIVGSIPTDSWYACVNDDNSDGEINRYDQTPDVIIGRFSVDNVDELSILARKTINHELGQVELWRKKITLIHGFNPDEISCDFFEELVESLAHQNEYQLSEILSRPEMTPVQIRTSFLNIINQGRGIINLHAHGGQDCWGDGQGWRLFQASDLSSLSNNCRLPIFLSFACHTGNFANPEGDCIGEILLHCQNKGAVAFIGPTKEMSFNYTSRLNKNIFDYLGKCQELDIGTLFFLANFYTGFTPEYNLLGDPCLSLLKTKIQSRVDLSICKEDIYIDWPLLSENPISITMKICNLGFDNAKNVGIKCYSGNPEENNSLIIQKFTICEVPCLGGSFNTRIEVTDEIDKSRPIYVLVDPDNHIKEIDETNNVVSISLSPPQFYEMAEEAGIDDSYRSKLSAFADYNQDGYLDLFVANSKQLFNSHQNNGNGTFMDVTQQLGINFNSEAKSLNIVDYDNDTHLDIYIVTNRLEHIIYRNNGDETFTPYEPATKHGERLTGLPFAFLDVDQDGLLDIHCRNIMKSPSILYRQVSAGIFKDISLQAGLGTTTGAFYTAYCDVDDDNDLDIYVLKQIPGNNTLFRNNGNGTFSDVTKSAGLAISEQTLWAEFVDYDNDGDFDLFVSGKALNATIFKNDGYGTFTKTPLFDDLSETSFGKTGTFLDYDNDGWSDLFIPKQHRFFKNTGSGKLVEQKYVLHRDDPRWNASVAVGDFDNDGDLDLFGTESNISFPNRLYTNLEEKNNWLVVKTLGTTCNSFGIGAKIKVVSGKLIQTREIICTTNDVLQTSLPVEFGLGQNTNIDTVIVRWPSGITDVLTAVDINSIVTVKEGYGDVDRPQSVNQVQNYPNPFNAETTIYYQVAKPAQVTITIYNLLGQEVKRLVDDIQEADNQSVVWDGRNDLDQLVSCGVYFYQIKIVNMKSKKIETIENRKLMMLK